MLNNKPPNETKAMLFTNKKLDEPTHISLNNESIEYVHFLSIWVGGSCSRFELEALSLTIYEIHRYQK